MTYIQQGETWATTRSKINQVIKVSYTDLLADTELTYTGGASGTVTAGDLYPTTNGNWFEVAASDAVDQHITTAGGVKLYEAGPHFSSRARAVAAWARMDARSETPPVGTVWTFDGVSIEYDGSTTGMNGLPKWKPFGDVYLDHFGTNANPGTTDMTTFAQAAIDYVTAGGADGGPIYLLNTSYNITPASLTVSGEEVITWVLPAGGTLPDDMPGRVVTLGQHDQPHAGGLGASTRPGTAYKVTKARHSVITTQANQQDSIEYIEGEMVPPSAGSGLTTELAGHRVNMRIEGGTESGAGVRGYHATVTGNDGNGKLRAARFIAIGLDDHDGLVNGMTVTATRTGVIPTSAGGNGVDEYASGDAGPYPNEDSAFAAAVGPGIRRVIVMEGQGGKERPQYGLLQKFGSQAILPETAVIGLHGGGNGDIISVARDETDAADIISVWENDGQFAAQAFRSNVTTLTIADDASETIALPRTGGFIFLHSPGSSTRYASVFFRAIAGSEVCSGLHLGSSIEVGTGPYTGTTGTDGKVTVAIDDQNLIIENRAGASVQFNFTVV